jgi:hypothetical protein
VTEADQHDAVVADLRRQLPDIVDKALGQADVASSMAQYQLTPTMLQDVARQAYGDVMATTAAEIVAVRSARAQVEENERLMQQNRPQNEPPIDPSARISLSRTAAWLALAVVPGVLAAITVAALWRPAIRLLGPHWTASLAILLIILAAVGTAKTIGRAAASAESRSYFYFSFSSILGLALGGVYVLAAWRLWAASKQYGWSLDWTHLGPLVRLGRDRPDLTHDLVWALAGLLSLAGAYAGYYSIIGYRMVLQPMARAVLLGPLICVAAVLPAWTTVAHYLSPGWVQVLRAALVSAGAITIVASLLSARREANGQGRWEPYSRLTPDMGLLNTRVGWQDLRTLRERASTALVEWEAAALDSVLRILRSHINAYKVPEFAVAFTPHGAPGLRSLRSEDYVVPTRMFEQFRQKLSAMGGGALGIAGPRGVGKSTLLTAFQKGRFLEPGQLPPPLVVFEAVPTHYNGRDFALHLYARLCQAAMDMARRDGARSKRRWRLRAPRRTILTVVNLTVVWVSLGILAPVLTRDPQETPAHWIQRIWWLAGIVILLSTVAFKVAADRYALPESILNRSESARATPRYLTDFYRQAEQRLNDIRFQQRFTTGWSGKVGIPFGSELSHSGSTEWTAQAKSYPEIIHEIRAFLRLTLEAIGQRPEAPTEPVVIIIDELDKVTSGELAVEFINEVKAIFGVEATTTQGRYACVYLVSISEDAIVALQRRGVLVGDAFDSAFDDVFTMEPLTLQDTYTLLRQRVIGMPGPFLALCHCLAGGLPRELLRSARDIVSNGGPGSAPIRLADAARLLVGQELTRHTRAVRTAATSTAAADRNLSETIAALEQTSRARHDPVAMIDLIARFTVAVGATSNPLAADDPTHPGYAVIAPALAHLYYSATLLEVFAEDLQENRFIDGRDTTGVGAFDALASARGHLRLDSRLAWATTSLFRDAWGLRTIDVP